MDGFKRPARPQNRGQNYGRPQPAAPVVPARPANVAQPLPPRPVAAVKEAAPANQPASPSPKRRGKAKLVILTSLAFLVVLAGVAFWWYNAQLAAVDPASQSTQDVEVQQGESVSDIATKLRSFGLIKNTLAFEIYAKLSGETIKTGTCRLSPAQTVSQIFAKLREGCQDFKVVTFFPGATIEKPLYKSPSATIDQTMYVKYRLQAAGFSDEQITAALAASYDSPLFAGKPEGSTLEGYIFGETYHLKANATAEDALKASFEQMYKVIQANDLESKFQAQQLNLFQGITLASIVQRELNCEGKPTEERKQRCYSYQQTIAQVFLKRLHSGVSLGSDVTFIYAADMMGVTPTVNLDSPYNTRIHTGLPPGPIASPGELALKAVGNPSNTDYMYFIAGDDGLIYFASTAEEHEANIRNHCQILCNEL